MDCRTMTNSFAGPSAPATPCMRPTRCLLRTSKVALYTNPARYVSRLSCTRPESVALVGDEDVSERFIEERQGGQATPGANQAKPNSPLLTIIPVLGLLALLGGGYTHKDDIPFLLTSFVELVEKLGSWGYLAYAGLYISLDVLCIPAVPLTMTAGVIFGPVAGTAMVSACSTTAATIAFLIARYVARDKVLTLASQNSRWASIDRAIGKHGLTFVTLLRLSPLLPLSATNYLYGLTSVDFGSYVAGTWLGMLPGTCALVMAGDMGRAMLVEGQGGLNVSPTQLGIGLGMSVVSLGFIGRLAKKAVEESEAESL